MWSLKRKLIRVLSSSKTALSPLQKQLQREDDQQQQEQMTCLHDVSYPQGYIPSNTSEAALHDNKPANKYPFALDPFLSEAIKCLDNGESVMVMTTEIWRSMQYKGSEVTREVAWVIFDEVHYMRDRERGVVWEESIVMALKNFRFVFLSATVPNAKEFADWVAKVHKQPCHTVYADYRRTTFPCWRAWSIRLYLVVGEKGKFREDNFHKALNALVPQGRARRKGRIGKQQKSLVAGKVG
ncbi:hypothetical protein Ddye_000249 [Dipteronia dyeriana]|uniref:Helicase ATP-binding domain-containing protein n=1 Tax=Dipteronia dyeriana TaxID=168575 RepID=A0AAE0CS68_9ROSI|nr:hypothetical protein Ddye_000249 [Dipteronia dyeriana]